MSVPPNSPRALLLKEPEGSQLTVELRDCSFLVKCPRGARPKIEQGVLYVVLPGPKVDHPIDDEGPVLLAAFASGSWLRWWYE